MLLQLCLVCGDTTLGCPLQEINFCTLCPHTSSLIHHGFEHWDKVFYRAHVRGWWGESKLGIPKEMESMWQ